MSDKPKGITNTTKKAHDDPAGTLASALAFGSSHAIERSEAAGQAELVAPQLLPADMCGDRAAFERLGIVFGDPVDGDPLFLNATLPPGWSREGSDHAMWSYVLDERGRRRISVFYKAAFYDRRAYMKLEPRVDVTYRESDDAYAVIDNATGKTLAMCRRCEPYRYSAFEEANAWMKANCAGMDWD